MFIDGHSTYTTDPERIEGERSTTHHALHAMWQQKHNAVLANPLGLARTDELIDDALGSVVEVTKLGLPQNQGIWTCHGKAKLKA